MFKNIITAGNSNNRFLLSLTFAIIIVVVGILSWPAQAEDALKDCSDPSIIGEMAGKVELNIPIPVSGLVTQIKCMNQEGTISKFNMLNAEPGKELSAYLRAFYVYFVWVVGILATVMVLYAGIQWIVAAGNASKIESAKSTMNGAFIGLVLTLTSYIILQLINPNLVRLQVPPVTGITPVFTGGYCTIVEGEDVQKMATAKKIECGNVFPYSLVNSKTTGVCMSSWCSDATKTCIACTGENKPFASCTKSGMECGLAESIIEIKGSITNPNDLKLKKITLWKRDSQFCSGSKGCVVKYVESSGDHFANGSSYSVSSAPDVVQLAEFHLELDFDGHDDCSTATFRLPYQPGSTVVKVANLNLDTCALN